MRTVFYCSVCGRKEFHKEPFCHCGARMASESIKSVIARRFTTFSGNKYYRDSKGNVYTRMSDGVAYCSNFKWGTIDVDKAEPSYPVNNVILLD